MLCRTMQLVYRLLLVMPQYSSGPLQNSRFTPPSGAGEYRLGQKRAVSTSISAPPPRKKSVSPVQSRYCPAA